MELSRPEEIVEQIYENLNRLEYVLEGPQAKSNKQPTKLRDISKANQNGDNAVFTGIPALQPLALLYR